MGRTVSNIGGKIKSPCIMPQKWESEAGFSLEVLKDTEIELRRIMLGFVLLIQGNWCVRLRQRGCANFCVGEKLAFRQAELSVPFIKGITIRISFTPENPCILVWFSGVYMLLKGK